MAFAAGGAGVGPSGSGARAPPLPGPDDISWLDYLQKYAFWKEKGNEERQLRFEKLEARWAKIQDQERGELDNQEQEAEKVVEAAEKVVAAAEKVVAAATAVPVLRCIIAHSEEDETVAFDDRPLIPDGYTLVVLANYGQTSLLPTVLNFLNKTAAAAAGSGLRTQLLDPITYRKELSKLIYGNERDNIHIYRPGARCPAVNVVSVTDFKDVCTGVVTYARSGVIDIPVSPFNTPIPDYLSKNLKENIVKDERYKNYTNSGTINPGYLCWGGMNPRNEFLEAVLEGSVYPEPSDVDEYETLSNLKKVKSSSLFKLLDEELIPGVYYFLGCRVIDFGDIEVQNFLRVVFPHEVRKRGGKLELRRKMVEADKGAVIARGDEFLAPNLEPLRERYLLFMSHFLQKYYKIKDGLLQTTFFLNTLKGDPFIVGDGEESSSKEMDDLTFVIAARIFFGEELEDIAKIIIPYKSEEELKRVLQAGLPSYFFNDEGELIRSIFQDSEHLFHSFSEKCECAILTRQKSKAAQNAAVAAAEGAGFWGSAPYNSSSSSSAPSSSGGGGGGGPDFGDSAPYNSSSSSSAPSSSGGLAIASGPGGGAGLGGSALFNASKLSAAAAAAAAPNSRSSSSSAASSSGGLSIASGPGGSRRKASSGGGGPLVAGSARFKASSSAAAEEGYEEEDNEGNGGVSAKRRAFGGGTRRNQTKHQRKTRRRTKTIKNRRKSKLTSRKRR